MIEIKSDGIGNTHVYLDGKEVIGGYDLCFKANVDEVPVLTISIYSLDENLKEVK